MKFNSILACTVGGSHQPIITAYNNLKPDFVCFICSEPDPGTKKRGSDVMIEGEGYFIKAQHTDEKATLPNIPTQLGLEKSRYKVITIPADNLDGATLFIRNTLADLKLQFPSARIVADYTGGTKTMTAALVIAVLETEEIDLQLVTGNRADLVKVRNGTELNSYANIDRIRLQRAMAPYLRSWEHFAYSEAADGLSIIPAPRDNVLAVQLRRARDLSAVFAAWDRFDHSWALHLLEIYAEVIKEELGKHLGVLKYLIKESQRQTPLRILDLWHNAERRAAQGRYDDAVARVYRLIEWTAQWLLKSHCGLDTGNLKPEQLPQGIHISPGQNDTLKAGLFISWQLVEKMTQGPAQQFATTQLLVLRSHIEARNLSILAHGFSSVSREVWEKLQEWMRGIFLPMLLEESKAVGIHQLPPQLPSAYIWND
ncbi:MAG: TIGR02710 family CRISPR-associated CARF protein [Desulfocapsaceae bacterium]|nr:TIGR02710 family CRISPR-associated CARF protein [Desulfocapsaceae bacterium]